MWRARVGGEVGPSIGGRQMSKKTSIQTEKLLTVSQQVEMMAITSLEDTKFVGDNVVVIELGVNSQANLGQTIPMDRGVEPSLEIQMVTMLVTILQPLEVA